MTLPDFAASHLTGIFLVFARFGTAAMFLPGFGESYINARARLALAAIVSIALYPATPVPALLTSQVVVIARILLLEVLVGLWIGVTARVLFSALHFAGSLAGYTAGLANALAPSLGSFEGATSVATLFLLTAATLIFATDTHHIMLEALMFSYDMMPVGAPLMMGDLARGMVDAAGGAMRIALVICAPFVVLSLLLNLGLGLANRAMPTLPVFFVAQAGLIASGLIVMVIASPAMLRAFLHDFADWLMTFTI